MIREKIDIHNTSKRYHQAIETLKTDKTISAKNKQLIIQFLRDAELGKTVLKKQKKKIGKRACLKYLYLLKTSVRFLRKDFDMVTKEDMTDFIYSLEDDALLKKNRTSYTSETKKDIKVALKKFYKWLLGKNEECPSIVKWLDTSIEQKDYLALTEKQIENVAKEAKSILDKAFVSILFDLGARIEEFLNVKKEDVIIEKEGYKIKILFSKTFSRTLPLDRSIEHLKKWLEIHPKHDGQLFPLTYNQCSAKLKRLGKQTLGIPITPQIIRHSKATQLAQAGVGRYQMCEWMGWAMSSKMPDRYIRREGIDNQKTLEEIQRKRQ
jgi:integrase